MHDGVKEFVECLFLETELHKVNSESHRTLFGPFLVLAWHHRLCLCINWLFLRITSSALRWMEAKLQH